MHEVFNVLPVLLVFELGTLYRIVIIRAYKHISFPIKKQTSMLSLLVRHCNSFIVRMRRRIMGGNLVHIVWGNRIQPSFALVRVVRSN